MKGAAFIGLVLVLASVIGVVWRARNGRFRSAEAPTVSISSSVPDVDVLGAEEIGTSLGERATFVQISSEVCSACRSTQRVLSSVAAEHPGVVHVELDAAQNLDLVRRFSVMRTPTTLVLDPAGALVGRMSGGTDRGQALAALASCPDAAPAL